MGSSFNPDGLAEFARHYGFHYDICDPRQLIRDVMIDMERGLRGQRSSLPMIPAYISPIVRFPPDKRVIALDAGGTNLRAALVHFDRQGKVAPENFRKVPMPGTRGRVGAEAFFDEIAALTAPLFEDARAAGKAVEGIGFCFSYPMEITENSDGILLAFSKEVDAPEVIGRSIGQGLREALIRRGITPPERIVLLNDTVAALLSGLAEIPPAGTWQGTEKFGKAGGPVIGCILGTGFNIAYPERSVPKIGFESEYPQIVVCESGTFKSRYRGILDREFDAGTKNPGAYTLEKSASGAYLGPLTLHILKQAVRDGLLRFRNSGELFAWDTLQTQDLNGFLRNPAGSEGPLTTLFAPDEGDALSSLIYLASIVTERAALFSAAQVAAAVERTGAGFDPFEPVRIAMEGTTYVIYHGMRAALESYLHTMLVSLKPRSYLISPVEQASLFGAAVAALSSRVGATH
jgi:hexokinase